MADKKPRGLRSRLGHSAGGCIIAATGWLARLLPDKWADGIGVWLGRLAMTVSPKYRRRTISNLKMCFPEWSDQEIRATARRVYEHFGKTGMRFLRATKLTNEEVLSSVDADGLEHLDKALEQGNGAIVVTAHFGNWERGAHYLAIKGYKLGVVAREPIDARTSTHVRRARQSQGVEVFARGAAAREVLRRLRRNECVALLPDQNTWEVYVPFFSMPAGTTVGPAVFHLMTGAPILCAFCYEKSDGRYRMEIQPLKMPELTGVRDDDAKRIMTAVNEALEHAIRAHPHQWLWMHDRWKAARQQGLIKPYVGGEALGDSVHNIESGCYKQ